jgi:hypothetical protein
MYNVRVERPGEVDAKPFLQAAVRCTTRRRAGKQNAIAYAANDAHGGIAVTMKRQTPPKPNASSVYLAMC